MKLPIVQNNERPDLCGPCGGRCCSTFPGIPHPEDLGAPDEAALLANVEALLATGRWVVDHDGSESRLYHEPCDWFLRPSIKGLESERINHGDFEDGPCTFLVGGRCEIYDTRPRGCRTLKPGGTPAALRCEMPTSKIKQVDAWAPYKNLLHAAAYATR